ncbi:MAG: hypothetical protein HDR26_01490 [Lachnospiraceae bacterium]|nr:hypothetical protein [Lachnospiraceae bacterium]
MGVLELVLLAVGGTIFAVSFIIPVKGERLTEKTREILKAEIRKLVAGETNAAKARITDIVEETASGSIEKAERTMERISNEKIMAVSEYSDTVLEEINKNHKEVLFLYDMLNDKHQNLKSVVSETARLTKKMEQTTREAQQAVREAKQAAEKENESAGQVPDEEAGNTEVQWIAASVQIEEDESESGAGEPFSAEEHKSGKNNNERILDLHQAGKSNVEIARELKLGVGEVKLVIDLFKESV